MGNTAHKAFKRVGKEQACDRNRCLIGLIYKTDTRDVVCPSNAETETAERHFPLSVREFCNSLKINVSLKMFAYKLFKNTTGNNIQTEHIEYRLGIHRLGFQSTPVPGCSKPDYHKF